VASFEELVAEWDGEEVLVRHDRPSGAWIFIALHSTRLGPAAGGTRLKVYEAPADGLRDVLRLAAGMTSKLAVAGLPFGGGKAVLAVPELPAGDARLRLLHVYADTVASLRGSYWTGPDMNTTARDMDVIGERMPYVFNRSPDHGGAGDPGAVTARGVFHGIRASVAHVLGSDELRGRSVLVQGAGSVGAELVRLLRETGAETLVSDIDERRAAATGARVVPAADALETECDVYAPCATGATLNRDSIPRLRCRIVAGSANNQLAEPVDAERLRERGILYAPDYVINAGGVLFGAGVEALGWDDGRVEEALVGIGGTLHEIFERADVEGITTAAAADALVAARLRPDGA
jgi:leucine dehydrogenase